MPNQNRTVVIKKEYHHYPRPHVVHAPVISNYNQSSGFFSTVKDSIASGIGLNLGSRLIDNIFGARKVVVEHTNVQKTPQTQSQSQDECTDIIKAYKELSNNKGLIDYELERQYEKCISRKN